jgi:predicted GIY-YIG superfamily endonuclease
MSVELRLGKPEEYMFYYVYTLRSLVDSKRYYVGMTIELEARLKKHNAGQCPHTSKFRPWQIEIAVAFLSKNKAGY